MTATASVLRIVRRADQTPHGEQAGVNAGEVTERLARQVDELTAVVQALARQLAAGLDMVGAQLGDVHVELDMLAAANTAAYTCGSGR